MLIGQINNGSLGLGGCQPIGNHYVSAITVTLLNLHCTVTPCIRRHVRLHLHTEICTCTAVIWKDRFTSNTETERKERE